jgi:RHS repeat-associated protein
MDSIEGILSDNSNSLLANNTFDLSNFNVIFGSLNADTLLPPTNSLVFSGAGDDRINTETEDSGKRIYSGSDDDELFASSGDRLLGGVGNDTLDASAGTNNRLYGGEGNDLLFAGAGDNILVGGVGFDRFVLAVDNLPTAKNTILDFLSATDTLVIENITGVTQFTDLTVTPQDNGTLIQVGSKELALLIGVTDTELTDRDFTIIPPGAEIQNLSVTPGETVEVDLKDTVLNNPSATFSIETEDNLPTGMLEGNGTLEFNPTAEEIGTYQFSVIGTVEGFTQTQEFVLEVVADSVTTTRVSGVIENTDSEKLAGVVIAVGDVSTTTDAEGKFTLEFSEDISGEDFLRIEPGQQVDGVVYPNISEKLQLLLEREPLEGINNVIDRPIFLPPIDLDNAVTIDPTVDTTVTTEAIPNASVFVGAGTLENQQGELYTEELSITEVPRELTPASLPENLLPDMVVTIQPGEMVFNTPAPLSLPNIAGYAPGTVMDLWSINPETGQFDNVGQGEVSGDGTVINTIEGGIRNSSWHFFTPTPNNPNPDNDRNQEDGCNCCKATTAGTSEVETHSGAVIETHDLVSYQSLGETISWTLTYDSLRADPRPIVNFGYDGVSGNFGPDSPFRLIAELSVDRGNFEYQVPGFAGGEFGLDGGEHFWTLPFEGTEADAALQIDLRSQPSGLYEYNLNSGFYRFNGESFTGSSAITTGEIVHVNSIDSYFGAGWGLAGLQEIVENPDGSVLLIDGDGTQLLFKPALETVAANTFDTGDEGWTIFGDAQSSYISTGGNPGGYLSANDEASGITWYWQAPIEFLQSVSDNYGSILSFDLQQSSTDSQYDDNDLVLVGGDITLVFDLNNNPDTTWTNYQVELKENAGWINQATGQAATQDEFLTVLSALTDLRIRGEYVVGLDTGGLDNVNLQAIALSDNFDSPAGDFSSLERLEDGTFLRTMKDGTVYTFNAQNQIEKMRDRNGNETQYLYQNDRISKIIDPVGLETTFTYINDRVTTITDPAGRSTQFEYDAAGNLIQITDPDGTKRTWEYDDNHHMTAEVDKRGNREETSYDFAGRADKAILKDGAEINFDPIQIQGLNRPNETLDPFATKEIFQLINEPESTYTDANGNEIVYTIDRAGQIVSSSDGVGAFNSVERNEDNLVTTNTDARGNDTNFTYDDRGNLLSTSDFGTVLLQDNFDSENGGQVSLNHENLANWNIVDGSVDLIGNGSFDFYPDNGLYLDLDGTTGNASKLESKTNFELSPGNYLLQFKLGGSARGDQNSVTVSLGDIFSETFTLESDNPLTTISRNISISEATNATLIFDCAGGDNIGIILDNVELKLVDNFTRSFTYDSTFNQVSSFTDELGRQTLYEIDPDNGNVLSVTQVFGEVGGDDDIVTNFTYTTNGLIDTITDPLGRITDSDYDEFGRLISLTYAVGTSDEAKQEFEYDNAGNQIAIIDENGNRTEFEYDSLNRLVKITEPDPDGEGELTSPVTIYTYDSVGNLLTNTDANGNVSQNKYDSLDRLIETIDALNQKTSLSYDSLGNLLSVIDPLGNKTENVYDERDRLIQTIDPEDSITLFDYDLDNNLTSVAEASLFSFEENFDSDISPLWGNEIGDWFADEGVYNAQTPSNSSLTYSSLPFILEDFVLELDINDIQDGGIFLRSSGETADTRDGILLVTGGENGTGTGFYWHVVQNGEISEVLNPSDSGLFESGVSDIHLRIEVLGDTYSVFLNDDLTPVTTLTTDVFSSGKVAFYDFSKQTFDNVQLESYNISNRTTFAYDPRNRLINETDPLGNITTYEYDAVDNLIAQTDRNNRRTEFTYDEIDRLLSEFWIGTDQAINYTYDKASNLLSVTDQFSSLAFTYDNRDRLITEANTGTPNAPNVVLTYAYDDVGNMLSVIDTINGVNGGTNSYSYDALNRLIELTQTGNEISDKRVDFAYNSLGQYTGIDRYSNLDATELVTGTTYSYDQLNRLTNLTHNNGTADLAFYDYVYDASSRITQITNVDGVTDYSYDDRDQLIAAEYSNDNNLDESYSYDANGNRIESSIHSDGYQTGDANRLLSDGTYNYEYDNEGNLIRQTEIASGNIQEFEWDYRNRLVAVVDKDADGNETQRVEFTYDTLDRRIAKTGLGTSNAPQQWFVYNGDDVHLEFVDDDGVDGANQSILSQRYLHGAGVDQILAQEDGDGNVTWMLTDHLGTVRDLVDNSGDVANHLIYDSFGRVISETDSSVDTRYLFTGREFDEEIGLYYYRARYYDAETGRFVSEDPIGFNGGDSNLYRYVFNNPISFTDSSGLECELGEAITQICGIGPLDAWTARNLAKEAFELAKKSGLPGIEDGQADAFRHCYWSCRMAQEIGIDQAKKVGDNHEDCGNNNPAATAMDLHNNGIGRILGTSGNDCEKSCKDALKQGTLQDSLKPIPSIAPAPPPIPMPLPTPTPIPVPGPAPG